MKTRLTFFVALICMTFMSNAQVKIISNGNVGVGTDNPVQKLDINGSLRGNQAAGSVNIQTDIGYTRIGATNSSFSHFYTDLPYYYFNKGIDVNGRITSYTPLDLVLCTSSNFLPRLTITSSLGNVGIGKTPDAAFMLDVAGDIGASAFRQTSDIRLKENVKNLDPSYNRIALLRPIQYNYKRNTVRYTQGSGADSTSISTKVKDAEDAFVKQVRYGFSAQDVLQVYPDLVVKDANGYLSIDYLGLIPVLVEAIQEQQIRISELEKKIKELTGNKIN
jgi:hypothetical protein